MMIMEEGTVVRMEAMRGDAMWIGGVGDAKEKESPPADASLPRKVEPQQQQL